jgi:hypothetical protein
MYYIWKRAYKEDVRVIGKKDHVFWGEEHLPRVSGGRRAVG